MAVVIRLRREGKKKQPFYRIVATDSRNPRDGRFLEILGQYNPIPEEETVNVNEERIIHWMRNGAKPSDTVKSLFTRKGLWKKFLEQSKPIKVDSPIEDNSVSANASTSGSAATADKEVEK